MSLRPKRLAEEGVPVAAILLFWSFVSWMFTLNPALAGAARNAGVVMAAFYVAIRGFALAPDVSPPATEDVEAIVRENARVAVAAGAWFFVAALVHLLAQLWSELGWPSLYTSPTEWTIRTLAGVGLGVVALYAVAAGIAAFGDPVDPDDETRAVD